MRTVAARSNVIENEYVTSLILLIINQRENVYVSEIGEDRVVQYGSDRAGVSYVIAFLLKSRKHCKTLVRRELEWAVTVRFETYRKLLFSDLIDDLDVFFSRLGSVKVLSHVDGSEIVHVLVDELRDRNFSEITMRLVSDQAHCEDVA